MKFYVVSLALLEERRRQQEERAKSLQRQMQAMLCGVLLTGPACTGDGSEARIKAEKDRAAKEKRELDCTVAASGFCGSTAWSSQLCQEQHEKEERRRAEEEAAVSESCMASASRTCVQAAKKAAEATEAAKRRPGHRHSRAHPCLPALAG